MKHIESKRFTFSRPPTGVDIVEVIKDNELHGWRMDIQQRRVDSTGSMTVPLRPYVWDVTFEKDVDK